MVCFILPELQLHTEPTVIAIDSLHPSFTNGRYEKSPSRTCTSCGGAGYTTCTWCQGSTKSMSNPFKKHTEMNVLKCTVCNKNGLVPCKLC